MPATLHLPVRPRAPRRRGRQTDGPPRRAKRCSRLGALVVLAPPLALIGLGALGCRAAADPGSTAPAAAAALVAREGDLVERVVLSGAVEARGGVNLLVPPNPQWQMTLQRLHEDGVEVAPGEVVAELDNSSLVAELAEKVAAATERRSELLNSEAKLAGEAADREFALAEARIRLAQAELEATVPAELRPALEAARKDLDLERARAGFEKAQRDLAASRVGAAADLDALRAKLETVEREVAAAREALSALDIRAPSAGLFLVNEHPWEGRPLQEGDTVWVGMPVGRLPDLATLEVVAHLEDVDDGRVVPGMIGRCRPDAFLDQSFRCRVVAVSPMAVEPEPRSVRRVFRVRLAIEDAPPALRARLLPGMSVRCELERTLARDAVVVPRVALDLGSASRAAAAAPGSPAASVGAGRAAGRTDAAAAATAATAPVAAAAAATAVDLEEAGPRVWLAGGSSVEVVLGSCSASECAVVAGLAAGQRLGVAADR